MLRIVGHRSAMACLDRIGIVSAKALVSMDWCHRGATADYVADRRPSLRDGMSGQDWHCLCKGTREYGLVPSRSDGRLCCGSSAIAPRWHVWTGLAFSLQRHS